jgi:hypothetical protein
MRHLKGDVGEAAVGQHAASAARLLRKVVFRAGLVPENFLALVIVFLFVFIN